MRFFRYGRGSATKLFACFLSLQLSVMPGGAQEAGESSPSGSYLPPASGSAAEEASASAEAKQAGEPAPSTPSGGDALESGNNLSAASASPGQDLPGQEGEKRASTERTARVNTPFDDLPTEGNALHGLFTPQPQYITPQTLINPQPKAPHPDEPNPLKGLFTPQPQYITPQTLLNPHPNPIEGEPNHFKGLFTAQPQYITPQTLKNPDAVPRFYSPSRLEITVPGYIRPSLRGEGQKSSKNEARAPAKEPSEKGSGENAKAAGAGTAADRAAATRRMAENGKPAGKVDIHPLRQALAEINKGQYGRALTTLDQFLILHPKHAQAHYLRAVALVILRRFREAEAEYLSVTRLTSDAALIERAQEGLRKLLP
ncbi:MAG TPA: tetratricopeptide repeat protein [Candidatus Obscuribacterales bacterium]